jgi:hypothetical protein
VHSGKKTHKSDLRHSSPEQFPNEIFLLERACDDQNMAAELPAHLAIAVLGSSQAFS